MIATISDTTLIFLLLHSILGSLWIAHLYQFVQQVVNCISFIQFLNLVQ